MSRSTSIDQLCNYCGSLCDNDLVRIDNSIYCCYGCATLDDVVSKITHSTSDVSLRYKQYDLAENFSQLVDYENLELYRISISLPAIHCSSCIELLEDLPSFNEGILSARVNFEQRRCVITATKSTPLSYVAQLLEDIGYLPQISLSQKQKDLDQEYNKTNLIKLAVAGFCFGNIMLYSFPHYFGLGLANDPFFTQLFSMLSVALSIPVLFYSGKEYLTSAYRALTAGKSHINIPISLGLLSLFCWSLYEIFSGTGIGYLDSLAGLVFFLLIGKWFQHKVYDHVSHHRNVQDFIPVVVRKKSTNQSIEWERIDKLSKGDKILVKNGEIIPVNGKLLRGNGVIDYSFITGEQLPERVSISDHVYAGGCQKEGEIEVELSEVPSAEKLWETWNIKQGAKEFETHWTNSISKYFTIAVVLIALISGVFWLYVDASKAAFVFSSVLIVACPCALALSAPFTYGGILRVFSNNNFFIKNADSVSTLSKIKHIVFDKTGTLTEKEAIQISFSGNEISHSNKRAIYSLASQSSHPLSSIIAFNLASNEKLEVKGFEEIIGKGISGIVDGKVIKLGSSQWLNLKQSNSNASLVYVSINGNTIGHFQIVSAYRSGIGAVLNKLGLNYNLSVLSGDNDAERSALQAFYNGFSKLRFNLKPKQKALEVKKIKTNESVLMIGDGLNDSSAIQEGNFGVAVTENLNGFYPGSDGVLISKSLNKLPKIFELARYSATILKLSLAFSLIYNIAGVSFAVMGLLTPIIAAILMPISSISVVVLDTLLVKQKAKRIGL
ncbi:MAG: heavy metal translocating P-type ATPase [Bacteroidia bacterium]|nr:heavy metal translocating P-type ATPase [Bacteroidia bacterium]NNJ55917.1 heavy metal translocating P-type ATPase [Bacteroidia bacterium]